jgi:electron-transferring-flavoprotein dehydrogenase
MLEGGRVVAYGGKTLPAGGWYSMPKLYSDGMLVVGDSASMVDVRSLKGIHLAIKSGMLAAETAFESLLERDYSAPLLSRYEEKVASSFVKKDLYRARNFHQALGKGPIAALPELALQEITGGRGFFERREVHVDAHTTQSVLEIWGAAGVEAEANQLPPADGVLFFDKLSSVYLTGTSLDEDSPNHLILKDGDICRDTCHSKFASPCNHFCPASVYEMVEEEGGLGKKRLQINYTNCIHCKTCDIKCPFDNILWTPPEGGGGPQYTEC